jgi:hypothetical protein
MHLLMPFGLFSAVYMWNSDVWVILQCEILLFLMLKG